MTYKVNLNANKPKAIVNFIKLKETVTMNDVMRSLNAPKGTVNAVFRVLREENKVHICSYQSNKFGAPVRVYKWGEGDDVQYVTKPREKKHEYREQSEQPKRDIAASWF